MVVLMTDQPTTLRTSTTATQHAIPAGTSNDEASDDQSRLALKTALPIALILFAIILAILWTKRRRLNTARFLPESYRKSRRTTPTGEPPPPENTNISESQLPPRYSAMSVQHTSSITQPRWEKAELPSKPVYGPPIQELEARPAELESSKEVEHVAAEGAIVRPETTRLDNPRHAGILVA